MSSNKAKITLLEKPEKRGGAYLLKIKDQGEYFIPATFFMGYNPGTKQVEIESYILDIKGISYKV